MPDLCIWRQSYLHRFGQVQTALTCRWGFAGLAEHEIGFAAFNQPTTVLLHIHVFVTHAAPQGDVFAVFASWIRISSATLWYQWLEQI